MLIDKNTKQIMFGNVEIKRIVSVGGVFSGKRFINGKNMI